MQGQEFEKSVGGSEIMNSLKPGVVVGEEDDCTPHAAHRAPAQRPAGVPRRFKVLTLLFATAAALPAVAIGVWYWQSPGAAVDALRVASVTGDTSELSQRIDLLALRDQLRATLTAELLSTSPPDATSQIGGSIAVSMTAPLIDARITPTAVLQLIRTGRYDPPKSQSGAVSEAIEWTVERRGVNSFRARPAAGTGPELVFYRNGLSWRLIGMNGVEGITQEQQAAVDPEASFIFDFAPIQQQSHWEGDTRKLEVSGTVTNITSRRLTVPPILVELRNSWGSATQSEEVISAKAELDPGESIMIRQKLHVTEPDAETAHIGWKPEVGSPFKVRTRSYLEL